MASVIGYLQALLTPTIGAVVAWIAFQQHRTARAKLRLDLFERRFEVYDGLLGLVAHVINEASVSMTELLAFRRSTRQSCFLFGTDVNAYLDVVYTKAVRFRLVCQKANAATQNADPKRGEFIEEEAELLQWFTDQLEASLGKFAPYMAFPH